MKFLSYILAIFLALELLLVPGGAKAALSVSDTLSDIRPSQASNHEIKWTVADASGIAEGESFVLTFASEFNTAPVAVTDVDLSDDGADITLAANCAGAEKASFVNNGNDTFTFLICPGDGGAMASGSIVRVKIGTNAAGGSNQIVNPAAAGGYYVDMDGSGGYSDSTRAQVVIMSGITTTATVPPHSGNLRLMGFANPVATVYFLEGGSILGTQVADAASFFDKTLYGLNEGIHVISIYATDSTGIRNTLTITFGINVVANTTTIVSGILLPPTISLTSDKVKRPASLVASGKAKDNASVQVYEFGTGDNQTQNVPTDANGNWSNNINPKLHLGNKGTNSQALDGTGGISEFSQTRNYEVQLSADLNIDNLVNLFDFSILMYNYGGNPPPNVVADINDNGPVDLVDFSVMMYYWTGG